MKHKIITLAVLLVLLTSLGLWRYRQGTLTNILTGSAATNLPPRELKDIPIDPTVSDQPIATDEAGTPYDPSVDSNTAVGNDLTDYGQNPDDPNIQYEDYDSYLFEDGAADNAD